MSSCLRRPSEASRTSVAMASIAGVRASCYRLASAQLPVLNIMKSHRRASQRVMIEYRHTYWCSTPGCACTAKYEHGGYFGWYYRCRRCARLRLESMDYVFPIGTFSK